MIHVFQGVSFFLCGIGLLIGSYTDLKTREVPDYINFFLLIAGFGIAGVASLIFQSWLYIVAAVIGCFFCYLISSIMFYTGQWGGGDAKMLMGLGSLIGIPFSFVTTLFSFSFSEIKLPFLLIFLILIFFCGGMYGSCWMIYLIVKHRKEFFKQYKEKLREKKYYKYAAYCCFLVLIVASFLSKDVFLSFLSFVCAVLIIFLFYGFFAVKIIEQIAFIKQLPIAQVTEGDWVAEDIIVNKKTVVKKSDLGITKEQLQELQELSKKKKIRTIPVKYGIPFVPSFLIAFVLSFFLFYYY